MKYAWIVGLPHVREVRSAEVPPPLAHVRVPRRQPETAKSSAPRTASGSSAKPCSSAHSGTSRTELRAERLARRRALPGEDAHRDHGQDGRDHGDRAARWPPLAAAVVERQPDQEDEADRRDPDRRDEDRLRPFEDPEEVEEEVEVPVGTRDEVCRPRVGGLGVERAEDARLHAVRVPVPDRRQADDPEHDDEAHDRVVPHGGGEERLPLLLRVVLVRA